MNNLPSTPASNKRQPKDANQAPENKANQGLSTSVLVRAIKHGVLHEALTGLWVAKGLRPLVVGGAVLTVIMGALLFGVGGVQGFWAYRNLQHEAVAIQQEVEMLKQQKRDLLWQINALNYSPKYLQHLVRQRLGWVAGNEVLLLVPAPVTASP